MKFVHIIQCFLVCFIFLTESANIDRNKTLYLRSKDGLMKISVAGDFYDFGCQHFDSRYEIQNHEENLVFEISSAKYQETLAMCLLVNKDVQKRSTRNKRFFDAIKSVFLVPGTKWCGWGNIASHPDDLGENNITDACCRDHDAECDLTVLGLSKNHGLTNYSPIRKSACTCDSKFYKCLLNAVSFEPDAADLCGSVYFNWLDLDCIVPHETKKCIKEGWWFTGCKKYSETETVTKYKFVENNLVFPDLKQDTTEP